MFDINAFSYNVLIYDANEHKGPADNAWRFWAKINALRANKKIDLIVPIYSWGDGHKVIKAMANYEKMHKNVKYPAVIQYWGHGAPGKVTCGSDDNAVKLLDEFYPYVDAATVFWFRTCETFQGKKGKDFARLASSRLHCFVAGYTHKIWLWQSGLHVVAGSALDGYPRTDWDDGEGVGKWSAPWIKNTNLAATVDFPHKVLF